MKCGSRGKHFWTDCGYSNVMCTSTYRKSNGVSWILKSQKGIFVGNVSHVKGYRFFDQRKFFCKGHCQTVVLAAGLTVEWMLVCHGFTHEDGIDYEEAFAPLAEGNAMRTMLALTTKQGKGDLVSSFLEP